MALWSGHQGLRHVVRAISLFVLVSVILATVVISFIDLETAANIAQVVSVIGLLSLSGALSTSQRADPPTQAEVVVEPRPSDPQAVEAPSAATPPQLTATPPGEDETEGGGEDHSAAVPPASMDPSGRWLRWQSRIIRTTAVVALVAAVVSAGVAVIPSVLNNLGRNYNDGTDIPGALRQSLVQIAGPLPINYNAGRTWKWVDLPNGTTTVTFSPGGGVRNDGLQALDGHIYAVDSCESNANDVSWAISADGNLIGDNESRSSPLYLFELPDRASEIVLTIEVTHDPSQECVLGLNWQSPVILRREPLPE